MTGAELLVIYNTGEYICNGLDWYDSYFAYYVGNNVFHFYTGDISLDGDEFTVNSGTLYEISIDTSGDDGVSVVDSAVSGITVTVGDSLTFSNLGSYPRFGGDSAPAVYYLAILITVIGLCMFVRSWFNHTYNHMSRGG